MASRVSVDHSVVGVSCSAASRCRMRGAALYEKLGFEKIGIFERAGWKFDRWVDVGYGGLTYE